MRVLTNNYKKSATDSFSKSTNRPSMPGDWRTGMNKRTMWSTHTILLVLTYVVGVSVVIADVFFWRP